MKETLDKTRDPEGVGLAAPQIGKSLQIFVTKPTRNAHHEVYINPVLTLNHAEQDVASNATAAKRRRKKADGTKLEGCLSIPTIWGPVKRAESVSITYLDETGRQKTEEVGGFKATILQHEYDHLHGILFPKRILEQKGKIYKSSKNEKGEDVFEEIEL
jgi:peptide deformylase